MIAYHLCPDLSNDDLNALFRTAWTGHRETDFATQLAHCRLWVGAYDRNELVGFVKLVWDGGGHGFVLDTTVATTYRRRGIGRQLLDHLAAAAQDIGVEWLHADFEPRYTDFYRGAGYRFTEAGILRIGTGG